MLDILACPMDGAHPLELHGAGGTGDVGEGALYCARCSRFFMITGGIPVMLPDDLRDKKAELEFLKRHAASLPDMITKKGSPWHI